MDLDKLVGNAKIYSPSRLNSTVVATNGVIHYIDQVLLPWIRLLQLQQTACYSVQWIHCNLIIAIAYLCRLSQKKTNKKKTCCKLYMLLTRCFHIVMVFNKADRPILFGVLANPLFQRDFEMFRSVVGFDIQTLFWLTGIWNRAFLQRVPALFGEDTLLCPQIGINRL